MEKLGINPWLLIAQIVNFVILLWLLQRFLYKPLLKLFRDRSTKIEDGLKTAEGLKKQAAESETRQKEYLEEAKKEAHRIVSAATKLGDEEKKKILKLAAEESRKIVEQTTAEMNVEKKNIMNDIKKEVGEMVVSLTVATIKKSMDANTQKKLLKEAVKEVEQELGKINKPNQ